jgi:hypothetical protein
MEQQVIYDIIANWDSAGNGSSAAGSGFDIDLASSKTGNDVFAFWFSDKMTTEMRTAFCSLPYLKCPTRRSGVAGCRIQGGSSVANNSVSVQFKSKTLKCPQSHGPLGDYASVIYTTHESPHCTNFQHVTAAQAVTENNRSPLRRAFYPGENTTEIAAVNSHTGNANQWSPRDDLSRWQSGTSNQLIFGEKNIPPGILGREDTMWRHDQSTLVACDINGRDWAIGRGLAETYPIWRADDDSNAEPQRFFGSWHQGICLFLVGDGSAASINVNTSGIILGALARADSMEAVSLP